MKKQDILIYGFEPFGGLEENVTEKIVEKLKKGGFNAVVLPVVFNRQVFCGLIKKHKPKVMLGMGMHGGGAKKIRIERKAVNLRKASKSEKGKKIDKNGPDYRYVNLKLKPDEEATVTYDAGTYVCNFSMYVISKLAEKRGLRFAFLHIPKDYSVNKAAAFVEKKIDDISGDL